MPLSVNKNFHRKCRLTVPQNYRIRSMANQISLGFTIDELLDRLYLQNEGESGELVSYFSRRFQEGSLSSFELDEDANTFLSDKLVALDREKAQFCYQICSALGATREVEAGTSF